MAKGVVSMPAIKIGNVTNFYGSHVYASLWVRADKQSRGIEKVAADLRAAITEQEDDPACGKIGRYQIQE